MKYVLPLALIVSISTPVLAAEYFVVRGPDKKCKVVETRPTDNTVVVVGDRAYVSRDEAGTKSATRQIWRVACAPASG
jgi:hypothetical protein